MGWSRFWLGHMHENGLGVQQSYEAAFKFYKTSAEHGDERGQVNLGLLYYEGLGIYPNEDIAREWFRLAAEQGSHEGQFYLDMA